MGVNIETEFTATYKRFYPEAQGEMGVQATTLPGGHRALLDIFGHLQGEQTRLPGRALVMERQHRPYNADQGFLSREQEGELGVESLETTGIDVNRHVPEIQLQRQE